MKYHINGLDRETGEPIELTIDGTSEEDAVRAAGKRGVVVEAVHAVPVLGYSAPHHKERPSEAKSVSAPSTQPPQNDRYLVVPFVAAVGHDQGPGTAAAQLQAMITHHAQDGWEYIRLESVETIIAGDPGCFGLGATPPRNTVFSMVVFRR